MVDVLLVCSSVCSQTLLGSSQSVDSCSVESGGVSRPRMVAQSRVFGARRLPRSSVPTARLVVRRTGRGLGSSFRRRLCFRPMVSSRLGDVYKRQRALGHRKSSGILCSTSSEFLCRSVRGQLYRNSLSRESRGHSVSAAECHCAVDFALGGVSSGDLSSPIYHGSPQRPCGLPVSAQSSLGLRVDPQDRGISGAAEEVACDHRPVCHLSQSPRFNIFFSVPPSERLGDRCSAPELEWVAGVCLSALVIHSSGSREAPVVVWSPPYHRSSVLASEAMVSRSSGSGCGRSGSSSAVS